MLCLGNKVASPVRLRYVCRTEEEFGRQWKISREKPRPPRQYRLSLVLVHLGDLCAQSWSVQDRYISYNFVDKYINFCMISIDLLQRRPMVKQVIKVIWHKDESPPSYSLGGATVLRMYDPCAAAIRPYVKLRWTLVCFM